MEEHVKLRNIATIALILELLFFTGISQAEEPLLSFHSFVGTIKFQDTGGRYDAPAGTLIEAFIDNALRGSEAVTAGGKYDIAVGGTYEDDNKTITFKINGLAAGQTAIFNASMLEPESLDFIINVPGQSDSSSPAQAGGGGAGGASGENFSNIEVKEKYYQHISKDKVAVYTFTNSSNPILFVNITGNTSAGETLTMIEVLRAASALVNSSPPGAVYKNINIWVGTSGFAVPKNIKEAAIVFRVENSWIKNNNLTVRDVGMLRWDDSRWVQLETIEKDRDSNYTYYESKTGRFSHFAITGLKGEGILTPAPEINIPSDPAGNDTRSSVKTTQAAGFEVTMLVIAICALYFFGRKIERKKNY